MWGEIQSWFICHNSWLWWGIQNFHILNIKMAKQKLSSDFVVAGCLLWLKKLIKEIVHVTRNILHLHTVEIKYIFSDVSTDSKKADYYSLTAFRHQFYAYGTSMPDIQVHNVVFKRSCWILSTCVVKSTQKLYLIYIRDHVKVIPSGSHNS